jgi:hypothetical protein
MYFNWRNQDNLDDLRRMVMGGDLTYPDIAKKLGTTTGSVCAKVHRLGIGRGQRIPDKSFLKRGKSAFQNDPDHPKVMARQAAEAKTFAGKTVSLEDRHEHQCCYVIGDPTKRQMCGQRRTRGPYCAEHAKVCFPSPGHVARRLGQYGQVQLVSSEARKRRYAIGSFAYSPSRDRIASVDSRTFEEMLEHGRFDREAGPREPATSPT